MLALAEAPVNTSSPSSAESRAQRPEMEWIPGGSFSMSFPNAGSFPYHCEPHCSMGMKGEVVVE